MFVSFGSWKELIKDSLAILKYTNHHVLWIKTSGTVNGGSFHNVLHSIIYCLLRIVKNETFK